MTMPTRSKSAAPVAILPAKLISVDDIWWLLRLPLMVLIAWCTPPATWTAYAAWSARRRAPREREPRLRAPFADKIARTLSTWQIDSSPDQIAQDLGMLGLENTLQLP